MQRTNHRPASSPEFNLRLLALLTGCLKRLDRVKEKPITPKIAKPLNGCRSDFRKMGMTQLGLPFFDTG